jgi:hypothetical protein
MDKDRVLSLFGKEIIEGARDKTIRSWLKAIDGEMKSKRLIDVHENLKDLPVEKLDFIKQMIPDIVDACIHNFLFYIQSEETIALQKTCDGQAYDLAKISDSLAGELFSADGWIAKYSSEREPSY